MDVTEVSSNDACGIFVTNGGTIMADNALKLPIGFQASNEPKVAKVSSSVLIKSAVALDTR